MTERVEVPKWFGFPTAKPRAPTEGGVGTSLIAALRHHWHAVKEARSLKQYLRDHGIVKHNGQWVKK